MRSCQTSSTCTKNIQVKDFSTFYGAKFFTTKYIYLATIPFIRIQAGVLGNKQVWYVDDSVAASSLGSLRKWWDSIANEGSPIDCFVNSQKSLISCQFNGEEST